MIKKLKYDTVDPILTTLITICAIIPILLSLVLGYEVEIKLTRTASEEDGL